MSVFPSIPLAFLILIHHSPLVINNNACNIKHVVITLYINAHLLMDFQVLIDLFPEQCNIWLTLKASKSTV